MFKNLKYRHKIIGLVLLFVILFAAARKRSYLLAIHAIDQVEEIEKKLNYIEISTQQASLLNYEDKQISTIGNLGKTAEEIQQGILGFSSQFNEVRVTGVDKMHKAEKNGFGIITNRLEMRGDYNSLLKVIYGFEQNFNWAYITNVEFIGDRTNKKIILYITFQSYDKV